MALNCRAGACGAGKLKERVHRFGHGLKSSGNHEVLFSTKFNPVRVDGAPHNSLGFLSAAGGVNARDELTERQGVLLVFSLFVSLVRVRFGIHNLFLSAFVLLTLAKFGCAIPRQSLRRPRRQLTKLQAAARSPLSPGIGGGLA